MTEVTQRAEAIRQLVTSSDARLAGSELPVAALNCLVDLLDAGESQLALQLIEDVKTTFPLDNDEWQVRLALLQARAASLAGMHEESLRLARAIPLRFHAYFGTHPHARQEALLSEAAALIQLNLIADSLRVLQDVRKSLLVQPDSRALAWCAHHMATAHLFGGHHEEARRFVLEAIVSARRSDSPLIEAMALLNLARLDKSICRWDTALEASSAALAICSSRGFRLHANIARRLLAIVSWKKGDLESSEAIARDCRKEAREVSDRSLADYAALLCAVVQTHRGMYSEAIRELDEVASTMRISARSRIALLREEYIGDVCLELGRIEEAERLFDKVWPMAIATAPSGDVAAEVARRRAEVALAKGEAGVAYARSRDALERCRELNDRYEEAGTLRVLALSASALGRAHEANEWFAQGLAHFEDIQTPYEWGKLWLAYGDWLQAPDAEGYQDLAGSLDAYHVARDLFDRMGAKAKLALANGRIADLLARRQAETVGVEVSSERVAGKLGRVKKPVGHSRRRGELDRRSEWARETFGLITRNKIMLSLLDDVAKLAKSSVPILILGESGTGKELIASGLHRLSERKGQYIPINCSALPREVIESELFGHVVGAFSGATRDKAGLFEVCDGGTVFLDEIGEMSVDLQSKLLRFLERGESRRIGSNRNIAVDTRIVAATNRDGVSLERGERFRPDLYYRLAHAVVSLPPLRHRKDDVGLLADHFLEVACNRERKVVKLSRDAVEALASYPWPGNVRQLRSVIDRVVLLSDPGAVITSNELRLGQTEVATTLEEEIVQAERRRIREALAQVGGSKAEAARLLGMPRTTLINKLKRYGLA